MPIRVLIVEDEFVTLDLLRDYVEQSGYEVSGDAMSAAEAIEVLERFDTDLVVLDIRIRGEHDGVWLAAQIREHYHIPFIFLTANSDVANVRRAAETYPYGYLVKPFMAADIMAAIEVALKQHEKEIALKAVNATKEVDNQQNISIFLKDTQMYKKVFLKDILYIQAFKNYIEVIFLDEPPLVLRSPLYKFIEVLPKTNFCQIHRSFVVNTQHINHIGNDFVLMNTKKIPLGKNYKNDFFEVINLF